jgi:hypothetical protein
MKIKQKLRDKGDHYKITLYKEIRENLGIKNNNILILFKINNHEIIRIPNKDFHLTIPKKIISKDIIELEILSIFNHEKTKQREPIDIRGKEINLISLIPQKTIFGNDIHVLEEKEYITVWYSIGGGAKPIKIKKNFNYEKLAELIGFYFGDGNTSQNIRSFRLNNCESSVLDYSLNVLEELGISRDKIKVQIIYSSNNILSQKIKNRCKNYWSEELRINKNQIISVNRSRNKRESLKHGSARILIDNSVLVEIFLHGILKEFIRIIETPKNKKETEILKGFLIGLAAAEGGIDLRKGISLSRIHLSFDPHSKEVELYKKILENLGISYGKEHGNGLPITGIENFKILKEMDIFKMHKKRKEKFIFGYSNHKYVKR